VFEGNLPDYIFQISYIYFTVIKNTVDMFQKCFPQQLMSACVKWAKEHVECMLLSHDHARMLKEVGLDFSELVGNGVRDSEHANQGPVGLGLS
jgi:hypothetical protein